MKKSLLRIPFLICFLLSFISHVALAQTTIDFNDLSAGLYLTKSYNKNGFNFSINAGGGGQIVTRSGEGYQGSISLYDDNFQVGALTQWTIKKIDGTEFQFHSIFLKEPNVGASTSGTIQGFINGNSVGSSKTVDFNGLKSFVSDSDFYDIDEIRISAADINFHLDHFTFGPVYSPVDTTPAVVSSLSILGSPGPFATSISYSVNFNKSVTGVSTDDFRLTTTGTVTGNVNSVSGSGSSYTVTVNNISGVGTIRLDLKGGTDIANANGNIGTPAYTFAMAHTLSSNMNSDPTITGLPATITVGEDSTEDPFDISSASIGDIDAGSANLSLILVANGGVFDVAAGSGLTINGHLTDSLTLTGNLINLNNYINHPSNIYFRPIANLSGVGAASVTVYLTDNGNTGNGGGGTLNQGTVSINITPVNDAPIVSNTIPNQEASAVVAWSFQFAENTFTDVDDDDLTYSAELSNGNALPIWLTFTPSTRTFSGTPIVANIGNYEIKVIANDGNGKQVEDSFTLTVSLNNPNVVSVQSLSSNGGYKIGDVLTLQITFDQIVTVEGTPTLYLETGAVDAVATYSAGSGSSSLSFVYTVEEGHSSQDLDYVSFGSLTLNGGSIRNSNAIDASLTLPSHGDSGSLGANAAIVIDGIRPNVISKNVTIQLGAPGNTSIAASDIDNGSSDANGIASMTLSQYDFDCSHVGDNTVTLTITDSNGNTDSATAIVTVEDVTAPVVVTRNITIQLDATGKTSITAADIDNGLTDACGIASMTLDKSNFDCGDVGANTVTLTVTDVNGNTDSATAIVTVEDITAPVVVTRNITIQLDATGNASITAADIDNGSTDSCGIASMSLSQDTFDCSHVGDNTVTLTVTDVNGNTESATAIVTVEDITAPVVVTRNITVQLDATGNASITAVDIDNGSTDSCGIASMTLNQYDFDCSHVGDNTVTLTVTDVNGNTDSATAIVTVEDVTAPVVVTQNITIQLDATGNASITAADIDNGSTDACGIASMTLDKSSFDCGDVGANTVTLTVTDVNGNTESATAIVTVEDITAPVVVTRSITIQLDATGNASITAADIDNGSTDSCGIASMTLSQNSFDCGDVGANTVTLTVTDVNGNTESATAIVTVEDITAPVVVTRNITVQLDATGNASITAVDIDNGSTDACGIASMTLDKSNFDCGDVGANTVTLTVTDVNGNTDSATAIVTVEEMTAPVVVTRNITIQLDATGNASITAADIDNGSTDACGIASMTLDKSSFDCGDVGANTVTLTVTDVNGNTESATAIVTVEDITAPVVVTRNITIQLDATGNASITAADIDNGSADSCGIASMTLSQNSFDCGDVGDNTVTLTVTDVNGNTDTATAIVTVEDVTAPVVVTRNITIQLDATGNASINAAAIDKGSADSCGIASMTLSQNSFDCGDIGDNTVTLTVTDVNGNTDTATAIVTVEDITAPVVVTRNITIQLDATGNASITAADIDNGSTDACGIASMTLDKSSFDCGDVGANTVSLTVTDVNGNTDTATAIVTVEDIIAPVVVTRNITIQLDATGNASLTAADIDNGSSDTCGIAGMTLDKSSFDCGDVGDNTVTLTVTDVNGNTDTATAIVTVEDVTAPVVVTRNITIQLDATGNASLTAADIDNGSTDSCGIASMTLSQDTFDCSHVGDNTVTLTVTDVNGNTDTATAIVTVEDIIAPVVVTRNITIQLDATGNASITAADIDNGSADSCGIASMTVSQYDFDCSHVGDNAVTLTVTDVNGNTDTATAIVTVEDITAPVVVTRNITIQLDATGNASITAADIDNGSTDACGIAGMTLDKSSFDCGDVGDNTVTLTVTDVNGNTDTATAIVTVEDVTAPVVVTRNITIQLDATGNASLTAADIDNGSTDSCGIASMTLSQDTFDCSHVGDNTVTLTVTDVNGNTDTATAIVTVEDVTAPVVVTRSITIQLDATGNASISAADIDNGSTDSCGIASMTLSQNSFDCGDVGDNMVTLTVTDVNGNTDTATAIVTVEDITAPVVVTRSITIQLDATGNTSITAADIDNGSTDSCGIASMTLSQDTFDCSHVGDNTVTLTVTDVNGNTDTATAIVIVEDLTAPEVVTRNITIQLDATGNASISAADIDNGSADSCGISNMTLSQDTFDCSHVGENTITLTVTDVNGNTDTATAIVIVEDLTAPEVVTRNITIQLDATGNASITAADIDNGSTDSCGIAGLALDKSSFDCGDVGANTVTLTVTDINGNTDSATAIVTVEDKIAPVPMLAELPTITATCQLDELTAPTAVDNCGGDLTATTTSVLPITESTLVTWTFTDVHGNETVQTQQVWIVDTTAPMIAEVPEDFEVILYSSEPYILPDFTAVASASDNCTLLSFSQNMAPGTTFNQPGSIEVILTAVDRFDNESTASFTITLSNRLVVGVQDPELISVPWKTPISSANLPQTVLVTLSNGEVTALPVSWNTAGYNPIISGFYQFPGTMTLGDIENPDSYQPTLTLLLEDKLVPTDILLSNVTFAANISTNEAIGELTTVDAQDNVHSYELVSPETNDGQYFRIEGNQLYWNTGESLPGKTTFTLVVASNDRVGQVIERTFMLNRTRIAVDRIEIFNTFTPNNDGINDTWGVPDLQFFQGGRVQVFDRSGQRVFYTESPSVRWDGTFNGTALPAGTYYWVLESKETGEVRRGILNLLKQ